MFKALYRRRRLVVAVLAFYLVALALVVFWPTPVDRNTGRFLSTALSWLHGHGVPGWFGYSVVEWLSNVAMFVPFGYLTATLVERGPWRLATLAGFVLSVAVEASQLLFFAERTGSILDVMANTLGAAVGAGCFVAFDRTMRKKR